MYSVVPVISAISWRDTRKVDFYACVHAPSRLLHETQQGARDAPLDPLGHELTVAALQVVQSAGDELHGVEGDSGLGLQQLSHRAGRPHEGRRRLDRFSADRIRLVAERARATESLASAEDAKDHLVSLRRQLCQLHTAAREDEERVSGLSFVEEVIAGADRFRARQASDPRQDGGVQALKERYLPERPCEFRHVVGISHLIHAPSCHTG